MRAYLAFKKWPALTAFRGYTCTSGVVSGGVGSYRCARGETAIVAVSNH